MSKKIKNKLNLFLLFIYLFIVIISLSATLSFVYYGIDLIKNTSKVPTNEQIIQYTKLATDISNNENLSTYNFSNIKVLSNDFTIDNIEKINFDNNTIINTDFQFSKLSMNLDDIKITIENNIFYFSHPTHLTYSLIYDKSSNLLITNEEYNDKKVYYIMSFISFICAVFCFGYSIYIVAKLILPTMKNNNKTNNYRKDLML